MFLKEKWNNLGIKKKLFIISTAIILVTSIITYTVLFAFTPNIYMNSKKSDIAKSTDEMINVLETEKDINYVEKLNEYAYKNESFVFITNIKGEVIYSSNNNIFAKYKLDNMKRHSGIITRKDDIRVSRVFYFKGIEEECVLSIIYPNKMRGEIQKIMVTMLPIIALITLAIGILSQYIYSRIISKPLGEINEASKKIAKLDFSSSLEYTGDDEIAQLSRSINSISYNLQKTIKDLKKANASLVNDIEREKKQDRRRRDFLKAISHELKTPITIINGQIEGMIYNIGPYKNRDKYLKESLESVEELRKLVQEIISLAKYEEGLSLTYNKFNLNELIHDIVYGHNYFENERGVKIDIVEEGILKVIGDENIVKKVISNLINNSIKYSEEGKKIKVEINKNGVVKIINYSTEVEKLDKDLLFRAFYRGDKSRSKEISGNGLGLYIVKTLIEIHGEIEYDIEIEGGKFTFKLIFPIHKSN